LDPDLEPAEDLSTAGVEDLDLGEEAFLGLDAFRGEDALEAGEAGFFLGGIWEGGIGVAAGVLQVATVVVRRLSRRFWQSWAGWDELVLVARGFRKLYAGF
jgi:hypothetical protein